MERFSGRTGFVALGATIVLGGCASIVDGQTQTLALSTQAEDGSELDDARCELKNSKGNWTARTPVSVVVRRAFDPLHVDCRKEPEPPGLAVVESSLKALAFGNILFGGVVGVVIDAASGSAYDYPDKVAVRMGRTTEVRRPVPGASGADAGSATLEADAELSTAR